MRTMRGLLVVAHQKQLPNNLRGFSLECLWAVFAALPVGCLWYDFLVESWFLFVSMV